MKKFEIGEEFETSVVAIGNNCVFIDLGLKSEGIVDLAEFKDADGNVTVKEGDKLKVFFVSDKGDEVKFTTRFGGKIEGNGGKGGAAQTIDTSIFEKAYQNGIPIEGKVEKEIKGGFEIAVSGVRAFCPYSQMGYREKQEPSYYINRVMQFLITEFKNDGKNLVLSNRSLGEKKEAEKISNLAENVKVGDEIEGVVSSLQSYGAFIDIGGFEALLPVSEISRERIKDPADILSVGQKIKAKVISADWNRKRVSVSMKELQDDPWDSVTSVVKVGEKITGKIARIADFGIFVNIAKGIDGLVHKSTIEGIDRNTNLKKKFKVGDEFSVVVEKIDAAEKRIALIPATSKEQDDSAAKYLSSQSSDADDGESYNPFAMLLKK